jgi:hypothetical protein
MPYSRSWGASRFQCITCVNAVVRAGMAALWFRFECRVAWQTDGATPLLIASEKGHVDCVHALLDMGAAINQAMVGSTSSIAWHDIAGGCVSGAPRDSVCTHAFAAGMARVGGLGREVMEPMPYLEVMGSIVMMGCSRHINAEVRPGIFV